MENDPIGLGSPAWEHSYEAAQQIALMVRELRKHDGDVDEWCKQVITDGLNGVLGPDDILEV